MRDPEKRVQVFCTTPSKTKQEPKNACDINKIVARALRGQAIMNLNNKPGRFGDVSEVPDYATALRVVKRAEELFSSLPALVRKRFQNDPAEMLEFVKDSKNADEAKALGLLKDDRVPPQPIGAPSHAPAVGEEPKPPAVGG